MTTEISTSNSQLTNDEIGATYSTEASTESSPVSNAADTEAAQIEASRLAAWMQDQAKIAAFFNDPGTYISQFWQQYKPIFALIGYAVLALIAINFVLTIIGFIMSIPLVGSLLELIGIGYSIWFTNRYLLGAEKRQELSQKIEQTKQEFLGSNPEAEVSEVANTIATDAQEIADSTLVNSL